MKTETYKPTIRAIQKIITIVMQETCTAHEPGSALLIDRAAVIRRVRKEGVEAFGPMIPDGLEKRLVKLEKATAFLNRWMNNIVTKVDNQGAALAVHVYEPEEGEEPLTNFGMRVTVEIEGLEKQTYHNVTELHWNYPEFPLESPTGRVAFESNIHGTGNTWDISKIGEMEVVPETAIQDHF